MDFLDPRRKKAHRRRLFIGYILMAIVIALGTNLVLRLAYGFDIDRKSGTLIYNGIVFVDSKPKGAKVFLNDVEQRNRTDTRLVLPAGVYTVRVEADDYRHWERTFDLEGGEIQRLVYPYLIPNVLETTDVRSYSELPGLATQSPDRRWLLTQSQNNDYQFEMIDLNDSQYKSTQVAIPESIMTEPKAEDSIKLVEWSNDNRHVLFERTYDETKTEFLLFDRENPSLSTNINVAFGINPKMATLKNKQPEQIYYLESVPGVLRTANIKNKTISAPLLDGVIDYKTYGDDLVLFATQKDVAEGRAEFRILEGDKTYTLKNVAQSDNYVMDISKYDGQWYYVAGSSSENMAFVYEDPLSSLKKPEQTSVNVISIMRLENPRFVSFSAGTQFIGLQSGNKILTLDLEKNHQYRLKLESEIPLDQKIKWMDGHRYYYTANNQSYIVDFDGSNEETLVTSELNPGPFFDRDYDNVFTFENSKTDPSKKALTITVIDER